MGTEIAKGEFEVSIEPHDDDTAAAGGFARFDLKKTFSGDLQGDSIGQMLGAQSEVEGSAGYVALEKFTGKLDGREGSFQLQHSGRMQAGDQYLDIRVVPDSGKEGLQGIVGILNIIIENGKHYYEFDYEFDNQ